MLQHDRGNATNYLLLPRQHCCTMPHTCASRYISPHCTDRNFRGAFHWCSEDLKVIWKIAYFGYTFRRSDKYIWHAVSVCWTDMWIDFWLDFCSCVVNWCWFLLHWCRVTYRVLLYSTEVVTEDLVADHLKTKSLEGKGSLEGWDVWWSVVKGTETSLSSAGTFLGYTIIYLYIYLLSSMYIWGQFPPNGPNWFA